MKNFPAGVQQMCKCEQGLHGGSSAQRRGHFQGSKTCLVRVCAGDGHWDSHTDTHTPGLWHSSSYTAKLPNSCGSKSVKILLWGILKYSILLSISSHLKKTLTILIQHVKREICKLLKFYSWHLAIAKILYTRSHNTLTAEPWLCLQESSAVCGT